MRILLVEDEDTSVASALAMLDRAAPGSVVHVARSRDAAIEALHAHNFDLVICDIRIPPSDGSLGIEEEHGLAVHAHARDLHPGTPLIFLTAFATSKNTRTALSAGPTAEMFGELDFPVVQLADKDDPGESENLVRRMANGLSELNARCSVSIPPGAMVDDMLIRCTQVYARRIGAISAEIDPLRGLSGASVARVTFTEPGGGKPAVLAKVLQREEALEELERYNRFVPNRLAPGVFAPAITPATFGLQDRAALFFTLADPESRSLFQSLSDDAGPTSTLIERLRASLRPWEVRSGIEQRSLVELRNERITDAQLSNSRLDSSRAEIDLLLSREGISVPVPMAVAHGDLHGENVLVDSSGRPVMIDFGDAGIGPAPLDPVTLELSLIFHASSPVPAKEWLDVELARNWIDVDRFAAASPFPEFIHACRNWALEASCPAAVYAVSYAHAMRQLKYKDVRPELAVAIARSAQSFFDSAQPESQ